MLLSCEYYFSWEFLNSSFLASCQNTRKKIAIRTMTLTFPLPLMGSFILKCVEIDFAVEIAIIHIYMCKYMYTWWPFFTVKYHWENREKNSEPLFHRLLFWICVSRRFCVEWCVGKTISASSHVYGHFSWLFILYLFEFQHVKLTVVNNTPDLAFLNALKMALRSCCVNEPCNLKIRH